MTDNRFWGFRILALVVFIGVIVGTCAGPTQATTVGECRYYGSVNVYSNVGDDLFLNTEDEFHEHFCKKDGLRMVVADADTSAETEALREMVTIDDAYITRSILLSIFCEKRSANRSYMIYPAYRVNPWPMSKRERLGWDAWAIKYVERHRNCVTS